MNISEKLSLIFTLIFYLLSILPVWSLKKPIAVFFKFGIIAHLFTIVFRVEFSLHLPIMGTYETTLAGSFIITLLAYFLEKKLPELYKSRIIVIALVMLLLLYGTFFPSDYIPTTISEQGILVHLHVLFAWLAFGFFILAGATSGWTIFKRNLNEFIDEFLFFLVISGYMFFSMMMVLGIYYNFVLTGRWWRWDPIESAGLIIWLFLSAGIHLKLFYNWSVRRFAKFILASFFVILLLYKSFPFVPRSATFHNFDIILDEVENGNSHNAQ